MLTSIALWGLYIQWSFIHMLDSMSVTHIKIPHLIGDFYVFVFYNPKTFRKFLNNVDGFADGAASEEGSDSTAAGFS